MRLHNWYNRYFSELSVPRDFVMHLFKMNQTWNVKKISLLPNFKLHILVIAISNA